MHTVALVPGDGVGIEVIDQARRVVDAVGTQDTWTELPWGSAHYLEHGSMMPPDCDPGCGLTMRCSWAPSVGHRPQTTSHFGE
jgi:isocitrate/isopropylmalate dehydrogenase